MNARFLGWLLAIAPLLAVVGWSAFAADIPEPAAARRALGEMVTVWSFEDLLRTDGGPLHVVARALHLAALEVPGATARSVVWLNVLCAMWLAATLATLARRAFPEEVVSRSAGLVWMFVIGLLVASPGYGCNWLYGERIGAFLVPVLMVLGLRWLQGEGLFALRASGALLVAGLAPLCHANGVAVFIALVPALLARGRVAVSVRSVAWLGALLAVGNLMSWFSLRTATSFGAADADLFSSISAAPRELVARILTETGRTWLDVIPTSALDEHALGLVSWTLPLLLLLPIGRRDEDARLRSGPWWGCLVFGLAVTAVAAVRYELVPPVGSTREAVYGAFLAPLGAVGLLAVRFGPGLLPFVAGAFVALGVADWHAGLEDLRRARARAAQADARRAVSEPGPREVYGDPVELAELVRRGVLPAPLRIQRERLLRPAAMRAGLGRVEDATRRLISGEVYSSLRQPTAAWLAVVVEVPGAEPAVVATCWPEFAGAGRIVPWKVEFAEPLADGVGVRVVAWVPEEAAAVAIGPRYRVSGDALVVDKRP